MLTKLTLFFSVQCISIIGQIIKSVCVSASQWVRESVCHTKRVERSTDRNLPPIFTKLATKVEFQEMWLSMVFGRNPTHLCGQTGNGINPHHCKNIFNVKNFENGERYDVNSIKMRSDRKPPMGFRLALWPFTRHKRYECNGGIIMDFSMYLFRHMSWPPVSCFV